MNRRHTKNQIKEALLQIKNTYPKIKIRTDILVGFPSETEQEFEETIHFVKEIGFELVVIYGFSKNLYFPDYLLKKEIPQEIIDRRIIKAIKFFKRHSIACATA